MNLLLVQKATSLRFLILSRLSGSYSPKYGITKTILTEIKSLYLHVYATAVWLFSNCDYG